MARGHGSECCDSPRPMRCRPSRSVDVRASDGTRLHAEVFGPEDGYPIVLAHGITCAIRVWAYQINDLARDYRVIAYDHRGHGRSGVPSRRANYGLNFLAADLDAVLEATLEPGERAVIAGPLDGRHRDHVVGRALSAAGGRARRRRRPDQHHHRRPAATRPAAAGAAAAGRRAGARRGTAAEDLRCGARCCARWIGRAGAFVAMMAVGRDADPAVADFVYELFAATPPAGRGGWARALVDALGRTSTSGCRT